MNAVFTQDQRNGAREDSVRAAVLAMAVKESRPAILSRCLNARTERNYACFLGGDPDRRQLRLALPRHTRSGAPAALREGETVTVSFRGKRRNYFFSAVVEGVDQAGRHGDDDVIIVRWPDKVARMQRRLHERGVPPPREPIHVCFGDSDCSGGILEDLSVGGFRVRTCSGDGLANGALVTCLFRDRDCVGSLQLNAHVRHVQYRDDGTCSLGFEFAELETTAEGRCQMAHLAAIAARFRQSNSTR